MTTLRTILVLASALVNASLLADGPVRRVPSADAWRQALDLVPEQAISLVAMPNPKMAADDLAECMARLGQGEAALPMRPIDLFKSRLGLGAGIEESGTFVMWFETREGKPAPAMLVPVTDAKEFLEANFQKVQVDGADAWRHPELGTLHAKTMDRHVLLSTVRALVDGYAAKAGRAEALKARLGERGFAVLIGGDLAAWGGPQAIAQAREQAKGMRGVVGGDTGAAVNGGEKTASKEAPNGRPDPSEGLVDGVVSIDFDPLGVSSRSYAILDPASPMGRATRGGSGGEAPRLQHLPQGNFVLAAALDTRGLGGVDAFADLMAMAPQAPAIPEWILQNRQLVSQVEFAIYPSKLGVAGGGLLNEACVWLGTAEPEKAKGLMKAWMTGLSGTKDGVETKVVWEEGKTTKDGVVADAWSMSEQVVPGGKGRPNPMRRMMQSLVFGPRGSMGFVKAFPEGLLVTFSQRPDVLKRCTEAIEGGKRLEGNATITALRGWLLPDPDVEAYVGVGSLIGVVRQAAASLPGGGFELPDVPPTLEPVAFAMQVQDARVETATMVPSGVIGVMVELYRIRTQPPEPGTTDRDQEEREP